MREWKLAELRQNIDSHPYLKAHAIWIFPGEIILSLAWAYTGDGSYYGLTRLVYDADQAKALYQKPETRKRAIEWINGAGLFPDLFWEGNSPEELEEFCRDSSLLLPKEYRDLLDKAKE
ncbi:MAG: hypothetical protein HYU56_01935 [Candidatus Aenigmarchaeota archaeon]|nr:hypothetical protein [Candidatus Aenigmarchaeota archaeon]